MGHRLDRVLRGPRALRRSAEQLLQTEARGAQDQWQRVILNQEVDRFIASLDPPGLTAAEISGANHATKPWRQHTSLDYPDFDICAPVPESMEFDIVFCEQVLEHVPDPFTAASNLRAMCRPAGHVVVSTPFLIKVHELTMYAMHDYWRFTPRGLRELLERAGFEVLEIGAWGNRECVRGNLDRWPAYRRWHSLRNEPDLAVQVWAFARNPA